MVAQNDVLIRFSLLFDHSFYLFHLGGKQLRLKTSRRGGAAAHHFFCVFDIFMADSTGDFHKPLRHFFWMDAPLCRLCLYNTGQLEPTVH